jgi:hypothetical protein
MKFFSILISLCFCVSLYSQSDQIRPELIGLEIIPQIVDLSSGPQIVTIRISATDNISGIRFAGQIVRYQDGSTSFEGGRLISGNVNDGVWETQLTIPQGTQNGTAVISSILLNDFVQNQYQPSTAEISALGFDVDFEIIGSNTDEVRPELIGLEIFPQIVDLSDGPQIVTIRLSATDNISGIRFAGQIVRYQGGATSFEGGRLISGTVNDGVWETQLTIPQGTQNGTAIISSILLNDFVQNQYQPSTAEISALGFDIDFEIIGSNIDEIRPELVGLEIFPQIVDLSDGPQTVTIRLSATDNISGIRFAGQIIRYQGGSTSFEGGRLISGNVNDGVWETQLTIPQGTPSGTAVISSILLNDFVQNQYQPSTAEILTLGFDTDFEIVYSALPLEFGPIEVFSSNNRLIFEWVTYNEFNNDRILIQELTDNIWVDIAYIRGENNSYNEYSSIIFHDKQRLDRVFRLKQIDYEGIISYSNIFSYKEETNLGVNIYPNPCNTILNLIKNESSEVVITGFNGITYYRGSSNSINIGFLDEGTYLIKIGDHFFEKLIVLK